MLVCKVGFWPVPFIPYTWEESGGCKLNSFPAFNKYGTREKHTMQAAFFFLFGARWFFFQKHILLNIPPIKKKNRKKESLHALSSLTLDYNSFFLNTVKKTPRIFFSLVYPVVIVLFQTKNSCDTRQAFIGYPPSIINIHSF